jgi:hypothetical protein
MALLDLRERLDRPRRCPGQAADPHAGPGEVRHVSYRIAGITSAQVKVVSGAWGALPAPKRITTGAGDKVFPAVATRAGKVAVSYYTRDYTATHNPSVCDVAIVSTAPGVQVGPVAGAVCLDYAALVRPARASMAQSWAAVFAGNRVWSWLNRPCAALIAAAPMSVVTRS